MGSAVVKGETSKPADASDIGSLQEGKDEITRLRSELAKHASAEATVPAASPEDNGGEEAVANEKEEAPQQDDGAGTVQLSLDLVEVLFLDEEDDQEGVVQAIQARIVELEKAWQPLFDRARGEKNSLGSAEFSLFISSNLNCDVDEEKAASIFCEVCGFPPEEGEEGPPQKDMDFSFFVHAMLHVANSYCSQNFGMIEGSLNKEQPWKLNEKILS